MRILFFIPFLFILSCKKPEEKTCFKSAGDYAKLTYELEDFIHLDCFGNYRLNLIQDTLNRMVVKGGENLISQINFKEIDDSLYIVNNNKCRFLRSYDEKVTIDLHYKDLDYFKFDGGDTVVFQNALTTSYFKLRMRDGGGTILAKINSDYLDLNLESGSGDITMEGYSYYARLFVNSTGFLFCDELESEELDALNYGTGDLYCNPGDGEFKAILQHTGDIYYKGSPSPFIVEKIGSGELIKINP